jgi:hypothetical protein
MMVCIGLFVISYLLSEKCASWRKPELPSQKVPSRDSSEVAPTRFDGVLLSVQARP